MVYSNVFYVPNIKKVSGITTWLLELAKKYHKIDITIVYNDSKSSRERINQLKEYVRVIKLSGNEIECDKLFITYEAKDLKLFKRNETIGMVHTNFELSNKNPYGNRVDKVVAVSKVVADNYEKISGVKPIVCYNPLTLEEHKPTLRLVSTTRITESKGKHRMEKLAKELDKNNIPYQWFILSDSTLDYKTDKIVYMTPQMDCRNIIMASDYLVQLSDDNESYSYSINEALGLGIPIISTPLSVFEELGIKNKTHGYIIDFDMKNIPIEEIANNKPKVKYTPPEDNYLDILNKTSAEYVKEQMVKLRCIKPYKDVEYNEHIPLNKIVLTTEERAKRLVDKGYVEYEDTPPDPNNKYKISIIIPTYNQEELIIRCLNSIPIRNNLEIIVIDDASSDKTYATVNNYKKNNKDKNIILVHNRENKGPGLSFNRGLDMATGDYILRLDSDDYLYENQFNKIVDRELDGTDMVYYNLIDNNDRELPVNISNRRSRCGAVKFTRREFIGNTRCPDIRIGEDKEWNDELLAKQPTEKFTNRIMYHYDFPRKDSLTDLHKRGVL